MQGRAGRLLVLRHRGGVGQWLSQRGPALSLCGTGCRSGPQDIVGQMAREILARQNAVKEEQKHVQSNSAGLLEVLGELASEMETKALSTHDIEATIDDFVICACLAQGQRHTHQ